MMVGLVVGNGEWLGKGLALCCVVGVGDLGVGVLLLLLWIFLLEIIIGLDV